MSDVDNRIVGTFSFHALMRHDRFEVKVEVPKPKTVEQRTSILKVHMENMHQSGR